MYKLNNKKFNKFRMKFMNPKHKMNNFKKNYLKQNNH